MRNDAILPGFLRRDIDALLEAEKLEKLTGKKCLHMDCLLDEVYGSINAAYWDKLIDKETAECLRKKYLGLEEPLQEL